MGRCASKLWPSLSRAAQIYPRSSLICYKKLYYKSWHRKIGVFFCYVTNKEGKCPLYSYDCTKMCSTDQYLSFSVSAEIFTLTLCLISQFSSLVLQSVGIFLQLKPFHIPLHLLVCSPYLPMSELDTDRPTTSCPETAGGVRRLVFSTMFLLCSRQNSAIVRVLESMWAQD